MGKRILIIGQSFNESSGGGITLTNLFSEWDNQELALATYGNSMKNLSRTNMRIYLLGSDDVKINFPLSFFKKKYQSGEISIHTDAYKKSVTKGNANNNFRLALRNTLYKVFRKYFENYSYENYAVSDKLRNFIADYKPDIIYSQGGSIRFLEFLLKVKDLSESKMVIHIMDDWPTLLVSRQSVFKRKSAKNYLTYFFQNCDLHLSISDYMAHEYKRRYGMSWHAFHNSIDPGRWEVDREINSVKRTVFKVAYFGRIGVANEESISTFSSFVDNANMEDTIEFHIFSFNVPQKFASSYSKSNKVIIHEGVDYANVPKEMQKFDLLLLPLDFSQYGRLYARFSIPTKLSEYMISGIPIFVFAPDDCATSFYVKENNIGFVCSDQERLEPYFKEVVRNTPERERIAKLARKRALLQHNINNENKRFRKLVSNI